MSAMAQSLLERAERASKVAATHADEVDAGARFPAEAVDALRRERLLGVYVPDPLGGSGARFADVAAVTEILARGCSATGMIYAMHQIQVGCIVRHGQTPALGEYLTELVERQRLIASATSEAGVGGDTRSSVCAVERRGTEFHLEKNATVISYGAEADDILVTARREPDSVASDQVIALVRKEAYQLEPRGTWNTLGMRGTCSLGFLLKADGSQGHILPTPFSEVSSQTMVPFSHILWASAWLGIATAAADRARKTVRAEARKKPGTTPASASRLAELTERLHTMRALVHDTLHDYEKRMNDPDALASLAFAVRLNNLKITASDAVVDIVSRALRICGIAGYRNDSDVSLGRQLRDAHSAGVMILNDRLQATNATLLLAVRD